MFLFRWLLSLLELLLEVLGVIVLIAVLLLWGLNWIPFVPVRVIQKHFSERVPQWGWASAETIPPGLLRALQEVEKLPTFHKSPSLPARVAVQMFYPERAQGKGSFFLGEVLSLLWSQQRLWVFYANSVPFGGDIYGVKAAAHHFWRKQLPDLTPEEIVELAVRTRWPRPYAPLPAALQREKGLVLRKLLALNAFSQKESIP